MKARKEENRNERGEVEGRKQGKGSEEKTEVRKEEYRKGGDEGEKVRKEKMEVRKEGY